MIPKPINFSKQEIRLPIIVQHLKASLKDILILQEAFDSDVIRELQNNLKEIYPYQIILGKSSKLYQILPSGVAIFSKFPLKVLDQVFYDECNHVDCFASKGFLLVEVTINEKLKIHLGATHLQSRDEEKNQKTRLSQLNQIKKSIEAMNDSKIPLILGGDFNIELNSKEFESLKNVLSLDEVITDINLPVTTEPQNNCYSTPGTKSNPKWIDYIFLKANLSKIKLSDLRVVNFQGQMELNQCTLSDHYAVEGIFHYE